MWDERYGTTDYVYGTAPNGFLEAHAHLLPPGEVLCLAEGEGRNAVFLARHGHLVTAVDASPVGLAKARALAARHGVEIETVCADLADYPLGVDRWVGIVSIFAHLPPALRRRVHAQVPAALRPGGLFLLEAYTPEQVALGTGGPKSPELMMDAATLAEELAGLEFLQLEELRREVIEGRGHTGQGAVVQVVARKPDPQLKR